MEQGRRTLIKQAVFSILALFGAGGVITGLAFRAPSGRREEEIAWFPLVQRHEGQVLMLAVPYMMGVSFAGMMSEVTRWLSERCPKYV